MTMTEGMNRLGVIVRKMVSITQGNTIGFTFQGGKKGYCHLSFFFGISDLFCKDALSRFLTVQHILAGRGRSW